MTESYQAKRERMQKAQENLPGHLRNRISLRNAEAVAALTPDAQRSLAEALDCGLVKISQAIQLLAREPQASLEALLPAPRNKGVSAGPVSGVSQGASGVSGVSAAIPELAALLQLCYPDMPSTAAQALAGAPAMAGLRAVFVAQEALFTSRQVHPDFVIVTFVGLLQKMQERLDHLIAQTPAYQQALRQSGVDWKS